MVTRVEPRALHDETWDQPVDDWTPEVFSVTFYGLSQAFVVKKYLAGAGSRVTDEIQGLAVEALMDLSMIFLDWCSERDTTPSTRLFWSLLKQRIIWGAGNLFKQTLSDHEVDSVEAREEGMLEDGSGGDWIRTQISRHRPASTLHQEIATYIKTIRLRERIILDLFFFEGMTHEHLEKTIEHSTTNTATVLRGTVRGILNYAQRQVLTDPPDAPEAKRNRSYELPASVDQWAQATYGMGINQWMRWAEQSYAADVSYLIDFLDHAYGTHATHQARGVRIKERHPSATLTDAQVLEVRQLLKAGHSQMSIAAATGIGQNAISHINTGRSYLHVKDAA